MTKKTEIAIPETDYADLLNTAVSQIQASRNAIAIQVNTAAMTTYWNLGKLLYDRKIEGGYGSNVIQRLSVDFSKTSLAVISVQFQVESTANTSSRSDILYTYPLSV